MLLHFIHVLLLRLMATYYGYNLSVRTKAINKVIFLKLMFESQV
jgi:hypothetical protein